VPGLRDHVDDHWQTLLAKMLPRARMVTPPGKLNVALYERVAAVEAEASATADPLVIVAHSAGSLIVTHWAQRTKRTVLGALLATPPDLEQPLPEGYPTQADLRANGWLPMPDEPLPFPAIVAASRNDPLAAYDDVCARATRWGARVEDLGAVGHLNPASGFGPWPLAEALIDELVMSVEFFS
jgi:predicted alpha/beta hydrolase family esterase